MIREPTKHKKFWKGGLGSEEAAAKKGDNNEASFDHLATGFTIVKHSYEKKNYYQVLSSEIPTSALMFGLAPLSSNSLATKLWPL